MVKLLRLFVSATGMGLSLAIFSFGVLIHLAIILIPLSPPPNFNTIFETGNAAALLALLAGLFEGVGGAWFLFFLLHQVVKPALPRLFLFVFFIAAAIYGATYLSTHLYSISTLVRISALIVGAFVASLIFLFDLTTSFLFHAVKSILPHKNPQKEEKS